MAKFELSKTPDNKLYLKNELQGILETNPIFAIANDKGVFMFSKDIPLARALESLNIIRKEITLMIKYENEQKKQAIL